MIIFCDLKKPSQYTKILAINEGLIVKLVF